ncbi:hypothetical protein BH24PSE2_BH24PSE2_01120 [soil metagenome]
MHNTPNRIGQRWIGLPCTVSASPRPQLWTTLFETIKEAAMVLRRSGSSYGKTRLSWSARWRCSRRRLAPDRDRPLFLTGSCSNIFGYGQLVLPLAREVPSHTIVPTAPPNVAHEPKLNDTSVPLPRISDGFGDGMPSDETIVNTPAPSASKPSAKLFRMFMPPTTSMPLPPSARTPTPLLSIVKVATPKGDSTLRPLLLSGRRSIAISVMRSIEPGTVLHPDVARPGCMSWGRSCRPADR